MVHKTDDIVINREDIVYRFSRSSGPGGQNVNKLNTRVTLLFNVSASRGLTDEQKNRILSRLSKRISGEGFLTVVSQRHRTQHANRLAAQKRLTELLASALKEQPVRKATAVPYGAHQKRLHHKRHRGEIKQLRKPVSFD